MKFQLRSIIILFVVLLFVCCKKKENKSPEPVVTPTPVNNTPSVLTSSVSNISDTSAFCGGTVTSEGSSIVLAVGVCWDTLPSPTTLRPHTNNGAGVGSFVSNLTGLKPNKTYYLRAYASNSYGTAYGSQVTFTTLSNWERVSPLSTFQSYFHFTGGVNNVFATASNGFFVSSDHGANWIQKNNGLPSPPNVAFVGYNNTHIFASASNGIFSTTDGGNTWVDITGTTSGASYSGPIMTIGSFVFYSTSNSVYRSSDNGNTWTPINTNLTNTIAYDFASIGTMVFCCNDWGVYNSIDNGTTWLPCNNGITTQNVFWLKAVGNVIYASTDQGIFVSYNSGASWSGLNTGLLSSAIYRFTSANGKIYAYHPGGDGVYFYNVNANKWVALNGGLSNLFVQALAFDGSYLVAHTNDYKVWKRVAL